MDFKEAYDKLRDAKREALANSCNIVVGRRELEKALEALEEKNEIRNKRLILLDGGKYYGKKENRKRINYRKKITKRNRKWIKGYREKTSVY